MSFVANTTAGEGGSGCTIACSERVFNLYVLLEEVRNVYITSTGADSQPPNEFDRPP